MNDKRRLTRVRWVHDTSANEVGETGNNAIPWTGFPLENGLQPDAGSPGEGYVIDEEVVSASPMAKREALFGEEEIAAGYEPLSEEDLYEYTWLDEAGVLNPEAENVRYPLSSAILVLVALYIICGLAPLFVALFVSLRIFFWLEIGGWAIIIAWLIVGVRPPFMVWLRERKSQARGQARAE